MSSPMKLVVLVLAILAAMYAAILGFGFILRFVPVGGDPVVSESAFGRVGGELRVAIGICPDEHFERLSVYGSMAENPPPSSLLWEVRNPLKPTPGNREFTLGSRDGFAHETKRLETKLPKEFQIVYQSNFHTDQFGVVRDWFYELPSGRWYDGDNEATPSKLHTGGCGTS